MKYKFLTILSAVLFAFEGESAAVNFSSGASVLTSISISKTADLSFGSLVPGSTAGEFLIQPRMDGTLSKSLSGGLQSFGSQSAAGFTVTGSPNTPYSITLPAAGTLSNGSNTINILFPTASIQGGTASRTLNSSGSDSFLLGGVITVFPASRGSYTGNFSMVVNY